MSGKDDLANPRCFPGHEYAFFYPAARAPDGSRKPELAVGVGPPTPAAPGLPGQLGGLAHFSATLN